MTSIGAFITITNPIERQDTFLECLQSLEQFCDEIVIVDGQSTDGSLDKLKNYNVISMSWPKDFDWSELPKHMNLGLDALSTSWVLRIDADYMFHESDINEIKRRLVILSNRRLVGFEKYVFNIGGKCIHKSRLPIAINKEMLGDRIKFGHAVNSHTDLCYPIFWEGKHNDKGIPVGKYFSHRVLKIRIPVYVYDYSFKTKEVAMSEFWRFAKAYESYYGEYKWGKTKEESFDIFINMMQGRYNRSMKTLKIKQHPEIIQNKLKQVTKDQFYFNGWGLIK